MANKIAVDTVGQSASAAGKELKWAKEMQCHFASDVLATNNHDGRRHKCYIV